MGQKKADTPRFPRAKTPTVLQLEAVECGAAALAMILGYHGRVEPLAVLRRECGVSRDGSKASNMVKAARRYGLLAKGFSLPIEKLLEFKPPFIVFWNFNHFLVVEGFEKDKVFLNDPACGHRVLPAEEFDRCFTGVVLILEPGPDFQKGGKRPSVVKALKARLTGALAPIAFCVLAGFLLVIPGLAFPAFTRVFIDEVLLAGRTNWLQPLILAMVVAIAVQAALRFLQLRYLRRLKIMLSVKMSSRFMWHLLQLPARFYAQRFSGEVASRSQLNDQLAETMSGRLAQTAIDLVMLWFYAGLMLYYDVVLTLMVVSFAVANIVTLRWISARRVEQNMRVLQEYGKAEAVSVAGLSGIETIKSSGLESDFFARWSGNYTKATNASQDLQLSNQTLTVLPGLFESLTMALLMIVGAFRIIDGQLSIGMLIALQSLAGSLLQPINSLMQLGSEFQELRGALNRIDDVLEYPVDAKPEPRTLLDGEGRPIVRLNGSVELRGIKFGYSPLEDPLLEDFNLSISPGHRVALVGGSGSGKSTVVRLISGEFKPWEGEILFDGIPRDEISTDVVVNSFAIVEQSIFIFGGTVRENLTMWDDTVPGDHVARACEDAAIQETVLALPGGYDGELLEGGGNLSGGQRQRLEIARALVNDPSILVLDEATSALDTETERIVIERLRMRGCSCIVVSHRLSTIRDCDEIIVLDRGRVAERGTHDELMAADGFYTQLMSMDDESRGEAA